MRGCASSVGCATAPTCQTRADRLGGRGCRRDGVPHTAGPDPPGGALMNRQSWRFPATARSVPEARQQVTAALRQWEYDVLLETARLLTSELVTNAVLHARTEMTVTVEDTGNGVRISVTDSSPVSPSLRRHSPTATTGRGLRMLDQLAREWSVDDDNGGKTVWFTLAEDVDPWSSYGSETWLAEADA